MRALLSVALLLAPLPVGAQSLRGQWDMVSVKQQAWGTILIDAERRATFDGFDGTQHGNLRGYVAQDQTGIEILFTDGKAVTRLYCAPQSSERMECYMVGAKAALVFTRVGPGPVTLRRQ